MSWIVSVEEDDGRVIYLRRITPYGSASFTVDRADAQRFRTKADARAAVVKGGLNRGFLAVVRDRAE